MKKALQCFRLRAAWSLGALALVGGASSGTMAQSLVDNLGGALSYSGSIALPSGVPVTQIAFAPNDNAHVYVATFGGGILRYDYNPAAVNFISNPVVAVPSSIVNVAGGNGSLGLAFHQDPILGTVMYLSPAVPFGGNDPGASDWINSFRDQTIVRLTNNGADALWGNDSGELNQIIANKIPTNRLHQVNQLQIHGDTLYANVGSRTQNGGQTAAQNQAIGGTGVNQSNPGNTAYNGSVSFIEDLTLLSAADGTSNQAGFTVPDLTGNGMVNDNDVRVDTQPFTSTDPMKLRVYATGFRNNYGLAIDDTGEMWVSMNQNENPNHQDELHRNVTFQSDHQFFTGNNLAGDWKIADDHSPLLAQDPSQIAIDAGYFDPENSFSPFALLGFNTAAGGIDFFGSNTADVTLRGDVLVARNSGGGNDVLYVDRQTGASKVVLENLSGALEVRRDPFGNFLAGGVGRIALLDVLLTSEVPLVLGDLDGDGDITIDDWNLLKPNFRLDTSALGSDDRKRAGDLNISGLVDMVDISLFSQLFDSAHGAGSFAAATGGTVPEPASLIQIILAAGALLLGAKINRGAIGRPR